MKSSVIIPFPVLQKRPSQSPWNDSAETGPGLKSTGNEKVGLKVNVLVMGGPSPLLTHVAGVLERIGCTVALSETDAGPFPAGPSGGWNLVVVEDDQAGVDRARTGQQILKIRQLRAEKEFTLVPILLIMEPPGQPDLAAVLGAGVNAFLVKPFSNHALIQKVKLLLQLT